MPLVPLPPGGVRPALGAPPIPSAALQAWVAAHYAPKLRAGALMNLARNPARAQQLLHPAIASVVHGAPAPPTVKLGTPIVTPGLAAPPPYNQYGAYPDFAQQALKQMDADQVAAQQNATTTAAWLAPAMQALQSGQQQAQQSYATALSGLYGNTAAQGPAQVSATSPGGIVSSPVNAQLAATQQATPMQAQAQQGLGATQALLGNLKVGDLGAGALGNLSYSASQIPTVYAAKKNEYLATVGKAMADAQAQAASDAAKLAEQQREFGITTGLQASKQRLDYTLGQAKIAAYPGGAAGTSASGLKPSSSLLPLASGQAPPAGYQAYTDPSGNTYAVKAPKSPATSTGSGGMFIPGAQNAQLVKQGYTAVRVPGGFRYVKPTATKGAAGTGLTASQYASVRSKATKLAQTLYQGANPHKATQGDVDAGVAQYAGQTLYENQHDPEEIFPQLLGSGLKPADAYSLVTSVTGKRINSQNVYNGLRSAGIQAKQARAIAKSLTGQDVPSIQAALSPGLG